MLSSLPIDKDSIQLAIFNFVSRGLDLSFRLVIHAGLMNGTGSLYSYFVLMLCAFPRPLLVNSGKCLLLVDSLSYRQLPSIGRHLQNLLELTSMAGCERILRIGFAAVRFSGNSCALKQGVAKEGSCLDSLCPS